jgi:hypothetical protein
MRLIIGSGGCGFQRINQIINRLGYNTVYKINPIKMQNSFEISYNDFISRQLKNEYSILVGHFYLKYVESIINNNPESKILCLKGDKDKTINSLKTHFGFRNPLLKVKGEYSRYNLEFFDDYSSYDNETSLSLYYDDYYKKVQELTKIYPNNILIVDSRDYFEDELTQKKANNFIHINNFIIEDKYKISDDNTITASLHGGLGNNLFQMIECLVFCELNNLPEPIFKTWDCSELPLSNNADVILGGHGGSWEDFNNSFKNINFTNPGKADFDTKFVINDMFDFGVLTKYRNIILEKFKPSDSVVDYITNKYGHILSDSCSLHIRTWTSRGDVHSMPLDGNYYHRALSIVDSKNILVFTDNITNSTPILTPLINTFKDKNFILIDENQFISLFMISMCDKNIVNISTFSFWAAYLNKNQNNNIIIPNNFGHGPNMLGNNNWIKI